MKSIFVVLFSIAFCGSVFGQKININEVDKFTKERIIETSFEKVVYDKSFDSRFVNYMKNIWIAFRKVGNHEFVRIKWCSKEVIAIDKDSKVFLLDKEGNTYIFNNTEFTVAGKGEGTIGKWGSALYGLDLYLTGDIHDLNGKIITDIRICTTNGNFDFAIDKKVLHTIPKMYELFNRAINSSQTAKDKK